MERAINPLALGCLATSRFVADETCGICGAVEFDEVSGLSAPDQFLGLSEALKRLLGRPVDLVEASAVRNPYVRATINRSKELIYAGVIRARLSMGRATGCRSDYAVYCGS